MNLRQQAGGPIGMIIVGIIIGVVGFGIRSSAGTSDPALGASSDTDPIVFIATVAGIVGGVITSVGVVFLGVYLGVSRALEERDATA